MKTLAIIGTAGRKEDGPKMTKDLYLKMVARAAKSIDLLAAKGETEITAVSGGAAWSDHVAVSLYLMGKVQGLVLHLPAAYVMENKKFEEGPGKMDPGRTANYYHSLFSKKMGGNTLEGIGKAWEKGAEVHIHQGFKVRNSYVAKSDLMLAFTWGEGEEPKDGGTRDTWEKSKAVKVHVPLGTL